MHEIAWISQATSALTQLSRHASGVPHTIYYWPACGCRRSPGTLSSRKNTLWLDYFHDLSTSCDILRTHFYESTKVLQRVTPQKKQNFNLVLSGSNQMMTTMPVPETSCITILAWDYSPNVWVPRCHVLHMQLLLIVYLYDKHRLLFRQKKQPKKALHLCFRVLTH